MKIRITEPELSQIVRDHIAANVSFKDGVEPTVSFTATRGDDGIVAEIDLPYLGVSALPVGDTTAPAPTVEKEKAAPKPRQPRTKPDTNLFAGVQAPAAEGEATDTTGSDDASVTEAGDNAGEAQDTNDEASPLPVADQPKSLFNS